MLAHYRRRRFNSRSREGSDVASNLKLDARVRFNSRSREGSDHYSADDLDALRRFNSRSREGSDITAIFINRERVGFNSRSREGSDFRACFHGLGERLVSIRAPARGATRPGSTRLVHTWPFQFARPRGERRPPIFPTR